MPNINPASNGVLRIYSTGAAGLATSLSTAAPGNGYMWIGGQNWSSLTISGMAPGAGNTYRFSSHAMNQELQLTIYNGSGGPALTGNNAVYVYQGGINLPGPETFTGTLTVQDTNIGNWQWRLAPAELPRPSPVPVPSAAQPAMSL